MLGASLLAPSSNGTPAGIELTNYQPSDPSDSINDNTIVPFPKDPTTGYHNYTLFWPNNGAQTQYYFDGGLLKSPTKYSSVNPSILILNSALYFSFMPLVMLHVS